MDYLGHFCSFVPTKVKVGIFQHQPRPAVSATIQWSFHLHKRTHAVFWTLPVFKSLISFGTWFNDCVHATCVVSMFCWILFASVSPAAEWQSLCRICELLWRLCLASADRHELYAGIRKKRVMWKQHKKIFGKIMSLMTTPSDKMGTKREQKHAIQNDQQKRFLPEFFF